MRTHKLKKSQKRTVSQHIQEGYLSKYKAWICKCKVCSWTRELKHN